MTLLTSEMKHPEGKIRVRVRTQWFKGLLVLGFGAGGSMAIGLSVLQAFSRDPKEGYGLLKAWGPWALVVSFVVWVVWRITTEAMAAVREGLQGWVVTAREQAAASTRTADALTRLADQGGRSAEEVRRLSVYAAQEFPNVYMRFDQQDSMMRGQTEALTALTASILTLTTRLNEEAQKDRRGR